MNEFLENNITFVIIKKVLSATGSDVSFLVSVKEFGI